MFPWLAPAGWKRLTNSQGQLQREGRKGLEHRENTKHQSSQDGTPQKGTCFPSGSLKADSEIWVVG